VISYNTMKPKRIGRPKAKDPRIPVSIAMPRSVVRTSRGMARAAGVSYSRFMAGLIGDRLREIEKPKTRRG